MEYISFVTALPCPICGCFCGISHHELLSAKDILGFYETVKHFSAFVNEIIAAVPGQLFESKESVKCETAYYLPKMITAHGARSFISSIYNGLALISAKSGIVVVCDHVHPFVSGDEIADVIKSAKEKTSIIGLKAIDTVKLVKDGIIINTLNRQSLWSLQSPLACKPGVLKKACLAIIDSCEVCNNTAELAVLMKTLFNEDIRVVEGKYENVSIRNK